MKLHGNAKTCLHSRRLLVERVEQRGWTLAQAAAAGVSVRTLSKGRPPPRGGRGGPPRSALRARSVPGRTREERVHAIVALRRLGMAGAEIAVLLSMPPSTVTAILARNGLGRLAALAPPEPPNRYEKARAGESRPRRIGAGSAHAETVPLSSSSLPSSVPRYDSASDGDRTTARRQRPRVQTG